MRVLDVVRSILIAGFLSLGACGGEVQRDPTGTVGPSGASSCDPNPSGLCYPTDHVGTSALVLDANRQRASCAQGVECCSGACSNNKTCG